MLITAQSHPSHLSSQRRWWRNYWAPDHPLQFCTSSVVWLRMRLQVQKDMFFSLVVDQCLNPTLGNDFFQFTAMMAWHIWKSRCELIFQGCKPKPFFNNGMNKDSNRHSIHCQSFVSTVKHRILNYMASEWSPLWGRYSIFDCDGTWANFGYATRDCSYTNAEEAKVFAYRDGIELAIGLNLSEEDIGGDATLVVNCPTKPHSKPQWRIISLILD